MWRFLAKWASRSKNLFVVLALLQCALMVLVQAGNDYGWLGVGLVVLVLFPFVVLVPLVGWWFLPLSGMIWVVVFGIMAGLSAMLEHWAHTRLESKIIQDSIDEALE